MSRRKLVIGGTCIRSHTLTEQNTYKYPDGRLVCKICRRDSARKSQGLPPADPNEPVENWSRDSSRKKTHCRKGHELTEENTRIKADGSQECRECTFKRGVAGKYKDYNITEERFMEMLKEQGLSCAICNYPFIHGRWDLVGPVEIYLTKGIANIDHDHKCCPEKSKSCGKCVRGLLCASCNNGLGRFKDDIASLKNAIHYLESFASTN